MSLKLPECSISQKQILQDVDGNQLQLRLHSNQLYIMKVNSDGSITTGGEIILDPLPNNVMYGAQGDSTNEAVDGNITLDTSASDFQSNNQDDFISTMNSETGGNTVVNSVTDGSAVVDFTVFFDSSKTATEIDAVVTKLNSDTEIAAIVAKGSTMSALTATKTAGFTSTKKTALAQPALIAVAMSGGNLVFTTVGMFDKIEYKAASESSFASTTQSSVAYTAPSAQFDLTARLRNALGELVGIPKTVSLATMLTLLNVQNSSYNSGQSSFYTLNWDDASEQADWRNYHHHALSEGGVDLTDIEIIWRFHGTKITSTATSQSIFQVGHIRNDSWNLGRSTVSLAHTTNGAGGNGSFTVYFAGKDNQNFDTTFNLSKAGGMFNKAYGDSTVWKIVMKLFPDDADHTDHASLYGNGTDNTVVVYFSIEAEDGSWAKEEFAYKSAVYKDQMPDLSAQASNGYMTNIHNMSAPHTWPNNGPWNSPISQYKTYDTAPVPADWTRLVGSVNYLGEITAHPTHNSGDTPSLRYRFVHANVDELTVKVS